MTVTGIHHYHFDATKSMYALDSAISVSVDDQSLQVITKLASNLLMTLPSDPVELARTLGRVRIGAVDDARSHLQLLCLKSRTRFRRLYNLQLLQV